MTPEQLYEELTLVVEVDMWGNKYWFNAEGQYHRNYGPAVEATNGTKKWLQNGLLHREDGPAVEWNDGSEEWWLNGLLHREDGPAIDYPDGHNEWWLSGVKIK